MDKSKDFIQYYKLNLNILLISNNQNKSTIICVYKISLNIFY